MNRANNSYFTTSDWTFIDIVDMYLGTEVLSTETTYRPSDNVRLSIAENSNVSGIMVECVDKSDNRTRISKVITPSSEFYRLWSLSNSRCMLFMVRIAYVMDDVGVVQPRRLVPGFKNVLEGSYQVITREADNLKLGLPKPK